MKLFEFECPGNWHNAGGFIVAPSINHACVVGSLKLKSFGIVYTLTEEDLEEIPLDKTQVIVVTDGAPW